MSVEKIHIKDRGKGEGKGKEKIHIKDS